MITDDGGCLTGQLGRVGVIGGSEDYTGAPYFSAMASARLGCDMVGSFFFLFFFPFLSSFLPLLFLFFSLLVFLLFSILYPLSCLVDSGLCVPVTGGMRREMLATKMVVMMPTASYPHRTPSPLSKHPSHSKPTNPHKC